jgi:hypothetical protein
MDRVLKVVYDNWYDSIPLSNGVHPVLVEYLKQSISDIRTADITVRNLMGGEMFPFRWHNNLFKYFKDYTKIRPDEITDNNDIYIYPVEVKTTLKSLENKHSFTLNGASYTYTLDKTFSNIILKHLQTGKVNLVINYIHDPINDDNDLKGFEKLLRSIGINKGNVFVVAGNDYTIKNSSIKIANGQLLFPREDAERMTTRPHPGRLGYINDYVKEHDLDPTKIRSKKFLCFNRQLGNRTHRVTLAHLALKYNLLESSIFSFIEKISDIETYHTLMRWESFYKDIDVENVVRSIEKILPYEIDTQILSGSEKTSFSTHNNKKELYLDTYMHIVSETRFTEGVEPFISEKTYRPIANLQPFLYVGNYNSLRDLHNLGFKTFHPYINEDYDKETDPQKRMAMIEIELKKLNDLTIEQMHKLYYNMKDILIYNRNHLTTFINAQPYKNLIRDLENGI